MSASFVVAASIAVLLCSLTAGFLFAFAVVVMPGLKALDDAAYLRAFQLMDGVIQDRQPLFMAMVVRFSGLLFAPMPSCNCGPKIRPRVPAAVSSH